MANELEHLPVDADGAFSSEALAPEQRFAPRRPTSARAYIHVPHIKAPIGCILKDSSSTGASLRLSPAVGQIATTSREVPSQFTLALPMEHMQIECRVIWRQNGNLGVRFVSPWQQLARPAKVSMTKPKKLPKSLFKKLLG